MVLKISFVFNDKVQGKPVDLIDVLNHLLLIFFFPCIFMWLFSLEQSTSQLQAAARAGSQECISAVEQKLLRNQTTNKFIFKARDLGNWNYLGGISFNGNHRINIIPGRKHSRL